MLYLLYSTITYLRTFPKIKFSLFFFSRGRKPSSSEWGFLGVVPQLGASLVRWFWAPWRGLFSLDKNPSPWKNSYEHLEGWRKTNRSLEGRWLQSFLISYFLLKLNYSRIYRILILNHVGFSRWLVGFPAAGWCFRKKSGPENIFLPQGISLLSTNQPLFFFWCFFSLKFGVIFELDLTTKWKVNRVGFPIPKKMFRHMPSWWDSEENPHPRCPFLGGGKRSIQGMDRRNLWSQRRNAICYGYFSWKSNILLMDEILHHLWWLKPYK